MYFFTDRTGKFQVKIYGGYQILVQKVFERDISCDGIKCGSNGDNAYSLSIFNYFLK